MLKAATCNPGWAMESGQMEWWQMPARGSLLRELGEGQAELALNFSFHLWGDLVVLAEWWDHKKHLQTSASSS